MKKTLLALESVRKDFPTAEGPLTILDGIDLQVSSGETIALTGPSGSGKSTLLGLMAGLERPTSGKVDVAGEDASSWDEDRWSAWRRDDVGFIFQNFRLVPALSAQENASLPLELQGKDPSTVVSSLEGLGLGGRLGHTPSQLSGGEQQRVAIARAYAHTPGLILADEPTGSLDRETAKGVLDSLLEINSQTGAALVVVTHDEEVASRMSRRLRLKSGRLES